MNRNVQRRSGRGYRTVDNKLTFLREDTVTQDTGVIELDMY